VSHFFTAATATSATRITMVVCSIAQNGSEQAVQIMGKPIILNRQQVSMGIFPYNNIAQRCGKNKIAFYFATLGNKQEVYVRKNLR
jgi:hypothetical protein